MNHQLSVVDPSDPKIDRGPVPEAIAAVLWSIAVILIAASPAIAIAVWKWAL